MQTIKLTSYESDKSASQFVDAMSTVSYQNLAAEPAIASQVRLLEEQAGKEILVLSTQGNNQFVPVNLTGVDGTAPFFSHAILEPPLRPGRGLSAPRRDAMAGSQALAPHARLH